MYDTVAGVLESPPPEVLDPRRWTTVRRKLDPATGEVHETAMRSDGGLGLTLYGGRSLVFERSLPKALNGQNVDEITGPEVAVALGIVDGELAEALECWALPSVAEWLIVRADYPMNVDLGDEGEVLRELEALAGLEMPYKGRPVVGQAHTVTWSKGAIRLKVYGKFQETKGDPRARGLLRIEPGVFRNRTFRKLLGYAEDHRPTVLDGLTPAVYDLVHAKFAVRLRGDLMSRKEIDEGAMLAEMLDEFGVVRMAALLGWAAIWEWKGVQSRADMLAVGLGSIETRYRVLKDYRRLRERLIERGYSLSDDGTETADVEALVHRMAVAS